MLCVLYLRMLLSLSLIFFDGLFSRAVRPHVAFPAQGYEMILALLLLLVVLATPAPTEDTAVSRPVYSCCPSLVQVVTRERHVT